MSSMSLLMRLARPSIVGLVLALGSAVSAEAKSPYTTVCSGTTCMYHSHHLRNGVLDFYVSVGTSPITHFNVRYASGLLVAQREIPAAFPISGYISKASTFHVKPGSSYVISIQACYSRFLSPSSCTAWRTVRFTAPS